MYIISFIVLIKAIKHYKYSYPINLFTWVLILSVIDNFIYIIIVIILKNPSLFFEIIKYSQSFYQSVEYSVVCFFFVKIIKQNIYTKILKLIVLIIAVIAFIFAINGKNLFETNILVFVILEIIIVNISSSIIFIGEINESNTDIPRSNVILAKGLFVFINFTAPYFLISNFLGENYNYLTKSLNFINDIGYIIFFISLYKSYKCYQSS